MDIIWPIAISIAIVLLGIIALIGFLLWIRWRREMEQEHHVLQAKAFALEDKRFEVWKAMNLAHASTHGKEARGVVDRALRGSLSPNESNTGKVVSMFERHRDPVRSSSDPLHWTYDAPPVERLKDVLGLLTKAADMPEEQAREFLRRHGIENATPFETDDPPPERGA